MKIIKEIETIILHANKSQGVNTPPGKRASPLTPKITSGRKI